MAKKYYAVKNGRKIGVFDSWDECKNSVEGFSNAIYKSFSDYNLAHNFVYEKIRVPQSKEPDVFAYIDGSYDNTKKRFSYAGIIFENGKRIEFSNSSGNKEQVELRNVAGELHAAMYVMKYAQENKIKSITIYYDYAGIEMWATDKWKTNMAFTREYASYAKKIMQDVHICFRKVKAHSGIMYNEEVDKLAKKALYKIDTQEVPKENNCKEELKENEYADNLSCIQGNKASIRMNIYVEGKIITSEELLLVIKRKWKERGRAIKEIKNIKSYYDVQKKSFVVNIISDDNKELIILESSEFYG